MRISAKKFNPDNFAAGLYGFALGLGKKNIIADSFVLFVDAGFTEVSRLGTVNAILIMLAYSFQIYFDFSGYSDMAYFGFTNKLIKGETIQIFNYGNCKRDFTFVDDIVEGVMRVMQGAPERRTGDDGLPLPPYAVYNIGNSNPENLPDFVDILQQELVRAEVLPADYNFEEHKKLVPMQPGDVPVTYADTSALERDYGFKPATSLREGLRRFAEWYKEFYKV